MENPLPDIPSIPRMVNRISVADRYSDIRPNQYPYMNRKSFSPDRFSYGYTMSSCRLAANYHEQ
eukprot:4525102-Prorocentrum_lima.AAC.1